MATPRIHPSIVEIADIISDELAAYQCIPRLVDENGTTLNVDWHTVNHSVNFVDPMTGADTQKIESEWQKAKRRLVRNSNKTSTSLMASHLAWLWWRSINARPNVKDPFLRLMELPPAAVTAAATNLMLLASASGSAFGTLPGALCPSFLAVVVSSAPNHASEGQAIRDSWARNARRGYSAIYFLLGRHAQDATGRRSVVRGRKRSGGWESSDDSSILPESSVFGDVIRAVFQDTSKNQTLKSLLLLQWAHTFCSRVSFILKADDDTYMDLPRLITLLEYMKAAFENDTRRSDGAGFLLGKRTLMHSIQLDKSYSRCKGSECLSAPPTLEEC
ncbi:hypothetical protein HPB51_001399 [Rhipicephalus microplus]|uniref:Hexosyltransferase n=1 Tax=Rhipicephalus microplus TaxID=6941 RepID=A0A9J6EE30_RHIMP|nr:hypothetical protein HPB51_001399 [Rhipicephalus microplus]